MNKDEYSKIYEEEFLIGFLFQCSGSHLSQPVPLESEELESLPESGGNSDQLYVRCKRCDCIMTFFEGNERVLTGKWKCENCGRTVREVTPYRILEKINREFEESISEQYDSDDLQG